ncbi:MAG: peptidoglycan DD-metalloendopeptidase family protein [Bacteroidales bacterium]|nr:peptidoglycan DD-metalloendopeptidase family protein [Bacteroidales bacterium]
MHRRIILLTLGLLAMFRPQAQVIVTDTLAAEPLAPADSLPPIPDSAVFIEKTGEIPAIRHYGTDWNNTNTRAAYSFDQSRTYVLPLDSAHFVFPAQAGAVISPYGPRSGRMHTGTDYKQKLGDPIYAAWDGVVRMAKNGYYGYGNIVVIRHANGLETYYAHLSKVMVRPNQKVKAGDQIGTAGRTGRATTEHLHFETRFLYQSFNSATIIDYASRRLATDTLMVVKGKFYTVEAYRQRSSTATLNIPITEAVESDSLLSSLQDSLSVPLAKPLPPVKQITTARPSVHVVRSGDTLYGIARRYHTTVAKLCQINHIKEDGILSLGQKIKLP